MTYASFVPKNYLTVKLFSISLKALIVLMRIVVSSEVQPERIWLISTSSDVFSGNSKLSTRRESAEISRALAMLTKKSMLHPLFPFSIRAITALSEPIISASWSCVIFFWVRISLIRVPIPSKSIVFIKRPFCMQPALGSRYVNSEKVTYQDNYIFKRSLLTLPTTWVPLSHFVTLWVTKIGNCDPQGHRKRSPLYIY